jgi:hypothetical protein
MQVKKRGPIFKIDRIDVLEKRGHPLKGLSSKKTPLPGKK